MEIKANMAEKPLLFSFSKDMIFTIKFHYNALLSLFVSDNMFVVHSRLMMLDGPLLFFVAVSLLCYLKFHKESKR